MKFSKIDNELRVNTKLSASDSTLILTIDTGAQISILKANKLFTDSKIKKKEKAQIIGISKDKTIVTLGKIYASIIIGKDLLNYGFHVISDTINLDTDGIIGSDLLEYFGARINYLTDTIEFFNILQNAETNTTEKNQPNHIETNKSTTESFNMYSDDYSDTDDDLVENYIEEYEQAKEEYAKYEAEQRKQCVINFLYDEKKSKKQTKKMKPKYNKNFYNEIDNEYIQSKCIKKVSPIPIEINQNNIVQVLQYKANRNDDEDEQIEIFNEEERKEYLMNNLKIEKCSKDQIAEIEKICKKFSKAFYIPGDPFKHTEVTQHVIKLKPNTNPIFTRQYKIPHAQQQEVEKQLKELEQKGIIEKSNSAWNSPLILVKKHSEEAGKTSWRVCIDYRKLNAVTIPEQFPIPEISTIIENLGGSKIFTTLDLQGAFHQVKLAPECKEYTSFSTSWQKYQFTSTPFGLMGSPFTWLRTIHTVLEGMIGKGVYCYMDDLIIHSSTLREHTEILSEVLNRLIDNNLKLKISKSLFLRKSVKYLGFIISDMGIKVDEEKTRCIREFKQPKNIKELQRFLGMCNYFRTHIKGYSYIARNLYDLLKKNVPYEWTEKCRNAFETLKKALTAPPVLIHPNYEHTFIITCDSSDHSVGSVLSQGQVPYDKPVQYFSRSLTEVQQRYSTTEKEMLSIILALENFKCFIFNKHFIIYTDHRPITSLLGGKNLNQRLYRWKLYMSQYDFEIIYKKGTTNVVADFLSRIENTIPETQQEIDDAPVMKIQKAQTRAQTEKLKDMPTIQMNQPPINRETLYNVEENRHILTKNDEYDQIFYIFSKINCQMHKQLQHKLKTEIRLENVLSKESLYDIGNKRVIILLNRKNITLDQSETIIEKIKNHCVQNLFETIAINVEFQDAQSLFEFKSVLKETFCHTQIKVTLFLNKIIEVTDPLTIQEILKQYHNSALGGHNSFEKTKNAIRKYFNWHNMNSDIKHHIKQCEFCEKNKISRYTKNPMQISSTANQPFEKIAIDLIGEIFPHSAENHNYILTIIDDLTKWAIGVPIKDCTSLTIAHALITNVVLKYGPPKILLSDNASYFSSDLISQMTRLLKIKKFFTTPYRPQSSICERLHKDLNAYLRTFIQKEQDQWHTFIDFAIYSHNTTPNTMTKFTPYELLFGHEPNLPIEILKRDVPIYNYDSYVAQLRSKLRTYHVLAREQYEKRKLENKKNYDKGRRENPLELKVNDLVLILDPKKKTKFSSLYLGPYRVVEICGPVTVKVKIGNKITKIHTDRVKKADADYGDKTPPPIITNNII